MAALMYDEKAWKLIEEKLPEVAATAKKDAYFSSKPLYRAFQWGLKGEVSLEEIDELLRNLK